MFSARRILAIACIVVGCSVGGCTTAIPQDNGSEAPPTTPAVETDPQEPSIQELISQLKSPEVQERQSAAIKLGRLKAQEATPALLAALKEECLAAGDEGNMLKHAYYRALTRIGAQIQEQLRGAMAEEDAPRQYVAYLNIILGYWGKTDVFEPLVALVEHDQDGYVRAYAALALGHLGIPEAIPVLEAAKEDGFIVEHGDVRVPLVRECARAALIQLGVEEE